MNKISACRPMSFSGYYSNENGSKNKAITVGGKLLAGGAAGGVLGATSIIMNDAYVLPSSSSKVLGRNMLMGAIVFMIFDYLYSGISNLKMKE